jgi:very-short-patch-repair endonuclease
VGTAAGTDASSKADAWRALLSVAAAQRGAFQVRQAERAGVDRWEIHRRKRRGEVVSWFPGVYVLAGSPRTWERLAQAVLLAAGPSAALSHWSAAFVHGLLDVREPSRVDLQRPRGAKRPLPGVRLHDSLYLTDDDVRSVGGLRVTTVEWTITDLARWLSPRQLERVILDAWRRRLTEPTAIMRVIARRPGFRGRRRLLAILARADERLARSRSIYESDAFVAIRDAGLPLPEVNVEVELTDGTLYELDLAYLDEKLDIEADSRTFHRIAPDVVRDRKRQGDLETEGWEVLRVTNEEIRSHPERFVARVREVLDRRGHPAEGPARGRGTPRVRAVTTRYRPDTG